MRSPLTPKRKPNRNRVSFGTGDHVRNPDEPSLVRPNGACGEPRVASLHQVMESAMNVMGPGDVLLLDSAASLREFVDSIFYAILACPLCGKLDLITQRQYFGTESVICAHSDCSCQFRIDQKRHLTYLPIN